jgi:hypothetical protein
MTDWLEPYLTDAASELADERLEREHAELAHWKSLADTRYLVIVALTDVIHQIMYATDNGMLQMSPELRQKIVRTVLENDPFAKMARDR